MKIKLSKNECEIIYQALSFLVSDKLRKKFLVKNKNRNKTK